MAGDDPVAARRGACSTSASWSTPTARRSPRCSPPSTARCSPTRSAKSPAASRTSSSPAASRNLLKGGYSEQAVDRRRRVLDPPAARRRGRHHAVQLPGDGADVDVRQRPRLRQHVRAQAEREGPVGRRCSSAELLKQAGLARRLLQRRAAATRSPSTASSSTPTSPPSASSARRRSPGTSTRPAPRNGKRVQALGGAKNHMLVLPDADLDMAADAAVSAAYGSAGERCMAICVVLAVECDRRRAGRQDHRAHPRRSRSARPASPTTRWAR